MPSSSQKLGNDTHLYGNFPLYPFPSLDITEGYNQAAKFRVILQIFGSSTQLAGTDCYSHTLTIDHLVPGELMSHQQDQASTNKIPDAATSSPGESPALPDTLVVKTTSNPLSRDSALSDAVDLLIPAALERRQGILVTECGRASYLVQVDPTVPCGTIYEKRMEGVSG